MRDGHNDWQVHGRGLKKAKHQNAMKNSQSVDMKNIYYLYTASENLGSFLTFLIIKLIYLRDLIK